MPSAILCYKLNIRNLYLLIRNETNIVELLSLFNEKTKLTHVSGWISLQLTNICQRKIFTFFAPWSGSTFEVLIGWFGVLYSLQKHFMPITITIREVGQSITPMLNCLFHFRVHYQLSNTFEWKVDPQILKYKSKEILISISKDFGVQGIGRWIWSNIVNPGWALLISISKGLIKIKRSLQRCRIVDIG